DDKFITTDYLQQCPSSLTLQQCPLVSLTNITGIIGPLLFAFIYSYSVAYWDGLLWLMGAILYAMLLITAYFHQRKTTPKAVISTP
ncbi:hypothetical protein ACSTRK_005232, partial [Salmonella enterica subsp. enterica serovar Muenchen]